MTTGQAEITWTWGGEAVRSRDEVVRVDPERGGVFRPSVADSLKGGSPAQGLKVLGELVGGDEGQDMGLQRLGVGVVEGLDRGVLDRPVHPLGLAVNRHDGRGALMSR
jgi:hypothetical protein